MRFNNPVLCLIGKSGAGKSKAADTMLLYSGIGHNIGQVKYATNRPKRYERDNEYEFFERPGDIEEYRIKCIKEGNDIISDQRYPVKLDEKYGNEWRYILTKNHILGDRYDVRVIASSVKQYMDMLNYCKNRLVGNCANDMDDHFTPIPVVIDSYDNLRVLRIIDRMLRYNSHDKIGRLDFLHSIEEIKRREICQDENVISFKSVFKAFEDYYMEFFTNGEKLFDTATSLYVFNTYNYLQLKDRLCEVLDAIGLYDED